MKARDSARPAVPAAAESPTSPRFAPGASASIVATWSLIVAGLAVRIALALRPLKFLDGLTLPDDAYLSLTIARNLGGGLGPLYGDAYTNGFQPLYVFLMAPVYAAFPASLEGAVHVALVLLALCDALMVATLGRLTGRMTGGSHAPLIIAAAWCVNAFIIRITLGGLETSLSCLLAVLALSALHHARTSPGRGSIFILGILIGLAIVARIDNAFLGVVAAGTLSLPRSVRGREGAAAALRRLSALAAGTGIPVLPWLLYSYAYTGDLYPVSGRAVRFVSMAVSPLSRDLVEWHRFMLDVARRTVVDSHAVLMGWIALLAVFALFVLATGRGRCLRLAATFRLAAPAWAYGVIVALAYPLHIYAVWFFPRYLFPLTIPLLLTLGLLGDFLLREIRGTRVRSLATGALVVALLTTWGVRRDLSELAFSHDTTSRGYMNLGLWASRTLPKGTAIGSSQTGALSYFATTLRVVNLDGVVNRACFDSILRRKNLDYILDSGIEYVVGWPVNIRFIKVCSDRPIEPHLESLGVIPGFRSWESEWHLYRVRRDAPEEVGRR